MRTYKINGSNYNITLKADWLQKEDDFGMTLYCFYSYKDGLICSLPEKEVVVTEI